MKQTKKSIFNPAEQLSTRRYGIPIKKSKYKKKIRISTSESNENKVTAKFIEQEEKEEGET